MDFMNQTFSSINMVEAVLKVSTGKPVFMLSRLNPDTPVSDLAMAMGFVEVKDKEKLPTVIDKRKPEPKKAGPKKKAMPKAEPADLPEPVEKEKAQARIDVGKIRACYLANPPRDPDWIAGEMGLTRPEVVVILKDMEIYRGD